MNTKSELNKSGIYIITNLVNGKFYLGSSINIRKRWKQHRNSLKHNKHINEYLQNAYNKYGGPNFVYKVLEYVDKEKLVEVEQKYLNKLKPHERLVGYNLSPTAYSPLGTKHTFISRQRMSLSHIGKKQTKQTKEKIRQSQCKTVCQMDINGNIVNTFSSCIEAEKRTKIQKQSISSCCRRIIKYAGGFQWCYKNEIKTFITKLPKGCKPIGKFVNNKMVSKWNSITEAVKNNGIPRITICRKLKCGVEYRYV